MGFSSTVEAYNSLKHVIHFKSDSSLVIGIKLNKQSLDADYFTFEHR